MERTKRKTAGKRMGALVGKALEQDDSFWGHDTWAEDPDSGNDSFHESDEDSALKKDEFDSDFNDSESDREEEEVEAGLEAERELKRTERSNQQKSKAYKDIASAGRAMMPKRGKGKGTSRRVVGDGINAGIVLNFPPPTASSASSSLPIGGQALATTGSASSLVGNLVSASSSAPKKPASKTKEKISLASTRERRSQQMLKRLRDDRSTARGEKHKKTPRPAATKKAKRRQYGQEELLLEAIHDTESENRRWLLARKRVQDLVDQDKDSMSGRDRAKGKIIEKYHSRRGCLNTLTFPEMDSVPDILTRSSTATTKPTKPPDDDSNLCVITGKPAKYRDPKTKLGYYDVAAFKELRKREQAGEPLDQRPKKETSAPKPSPTPTNGSSSEPVVSDITAAAAAAAAATSTANSKSKVSSKQQNQQPPAGTAIPKTSTSSASQKPAPKKLSSSSKTKKSSPTTKQAGKKVATAPTPKSSAAKRQTSTSSTVSPSNKSSSNNNNTNPVGSSSEGKKTPETTKPVLSVTNSRLETSPVSPTRQSGRKWKPSAKLLENIIHSVEQKKVGALPLGIHLKPQLAQGPSLNDSAVSVAAAVGGCTSNSVETTNTTTAQAPKAVDKAVSNSSSAPVATDTAQKQSASKKKAPAKPRRKESKTVPKKAGKTTAKVKSSASQEKKGTKSTSTGTEKKSSSPKPQASRGKKTAAQKTPNGTPKSAPKGKKGASSAKSVKSQLPDEQKVKSGESKSAGKVESGTEKVYTIPADEATGEGPRFITQSELIMAAINNYNKSKEEKLTMNHKKKDDENNAKTKE